MKRALVAVIALAAIALPSARAAEKPELPPRDRTQIEALIATVENLGDARFIRNGKAYNATTAAKFLRGKWKDRAAGVRSVEDFIDKVATRSSTTGRPYLIRFRDGREVATAEFLRSELAKLRPANP